MPGEIKVLTKISEKFVSEMEKAIQDSSYDWHKPWVSSFANHRNGTSNHRYSTMNYLWLNYIATERDYKGTRWYTYLQIQKSGYKFKGNATGTGVDVVGFFKYDKKKNNEEEAEAINGDDEENRTVSRWAMRNTKVFNEDILEGVPPLPEEEIFYNEKVEPNEYLNRIVDKTGVTLKYHKGNEAYYMPSQDMIVLPPMESFESQTAYVSTLAHELAHSSGHHSRLNRDIVNFFGTENYAFEELCAEFAAMFLSMHVDIQYDASYQKQNVSYFKSWGDKIKKDPNYLKKAITTGWGIMEYFNEIAELDLLKEEALNAHEVER